MRLDFTERALRSLERSLELLADRYSPEQRVAYTEKIFERTRILLRYPRAGQREERLASLGQDHRRLVCDHFKIVYFIDGEIIRITDIFDSRRDPEEMIG